MQLQPTNLTWSLQIYYCVFVLVGASISLILVCLLIGNENENENQEIEINYIFIYLNERWNMNQSIGLHLGSVYVLDWSENSEEWKY